MPIIKNKTLISSTKLFEISRLDIEFPNNFKLLVNEGQQCIGGETIIAQDIKSKITQREFKKI